VKVLVVEDDEALREAVARRLKAVGYAADEAASLRSADELASLYTYDAVVLDRILPDGDSLDLLARWRTEGHATPVLFLTALGAVEDRVGGLSHGADDYLSKPFAMQELIARVAALVRRAPFTRSNILVVADLKVDTARHEVRRGGVLLPLRPKGFGVLQLLASRAGTVVSRAAIIEHCWDAALEPMSNVEESVIASLRRKLGAPALIHTIRGGGYVLEERS
jgi:DNA-binding response OmpR family regulator